MKKYGKIVCGALRVPQNYPSYIELEGQKIYNPTDEQYAAAGYLPVEETVPETPVGKIPAASYAVSEDGTKIVQSWIYIDEPVMAPDGETEETPKKTTKKKSSK